MNKIYEIEGSLLVGFLLMYHFTRNGFLFVVVPVIMIFVWVWWWRRMARAVRPFVEQIPVRAETYQVDTDEHTYPEDDFGDGQICSDCALQPRCCINVHMEDEAEYTALEKRWASEVKDLDNP